MKIGIAGPVDIGLLADMVNQDAANLPEVFSFPLTAHIARELHRQGHEVAVFVLSYKARKEYEFHGKGFSIYVTPARHAYFAVLDMFRKEVWLLRKAMEHAECDIIHAHWHYEFALAALGFPDKCLITLHDAPLRVFRYLKAPLHYRILRRFVMGTMVLSRSRHLTAVSPYLTKYFSSHFPRRNDITVIPNGIATDDDIFVLPEVRTVDGPVTFGYIGAQSKGKNPQTAIAAFRLARKQLSDSHLLMFGKFADDFVLENRGDGLVFPGQLPHCKLLSQLVDDVDILVQTTREESFGMAILEGMAKGVPVIGGENSGAVPYLLDYGKCGMLTDINDPAAVAECMVKLASDTKLCYDITCHAQERVKAHFLLPTVVEHYIKKYSQILGDNETT